MGVRVSIEVSKLRGQRAPKGRDEQLRYSDTQSPRWRGLEGKEARARRGNLSCLGLWERKVMDLEVRMARLKRTAGWILPVPLAHGCD